MSATDQEKFRAFIENPATAAFVGPKFDYYKQVWGEAFEKKHTLQHIGTSPSFSNIGALLMPPLWALHRKFLKPLLVLDGVILLAIGVGLIIHRMPPGMFFLALWIITGMFCNARYFTHVWQFIEKNQNLDQASCVALAHKKGGTSLIWLTIGLILHGIVFTACLLLLIQGLGTPTP